jgi:hypothetical protein
MMFLKTRRRKTVPNGKRNLSPETLRIRSRIESSHATYAAYRGRMEKQLAKMERDHHGDLIEDIRAFLIGGGEQADAMRLLSLTRKGWNDLLNRIRMWEFHRKIEPWQNAKIQG